MSGSFKKFVTEEEVSEERQKRQAEWDRVRKEDDPQECPEEETRSLFAQLEANKSSKDKEFEDESRLRSSVKGLDNEEAQFLNFVSNRQAQIEKERLSEEKNLFKEMQAAKVVKISDKTKEEEQASGDKQKATPTSSSSKKKSQLQLLSGAIKRKSSHEDQETKKSRSEDSVEDKIDAKQNNSDSKLMAGLPHNNGLPVQAGILPGISGYADDDSSTENDSRSSDSEDDHKVFPNAITMRVIKDMVSKMKGDCG